MGKTSGGGEFVRNRIHNATNPYQGNNKRVLAVCSAGLLRSPTVAWILSNDPWNYNTRAAGITESHALIPVDEVLVSWADEIVCVQPQIKQALENLYDTKDKVVVALDIPDKYGYRDFRLVDAIIEQYKAWQAAADQ